MDRRVVVGVDKTLECGEALHWAVRECLFRNCPIRVVHVYQGHRGSSGQDVFDAAIGYARDRLGPSGVSGAFVSGAPVTVLLAESAGAEVLVVGSRKRADPVSAALSSVSASLAWRASCPVLVARGREPQRRVIVGIRSPHDSDSMLRFAFDEAHERGQGMTVVHCFDTSNRAEFDIEQSLGERLNTFRAKYPDVSVTTDFVEHAAARTLIERSQHAGVVVVGSSHHGGGLPTSSVSQRVLYGAAGSVAVVREQQEATCQPVHTFESSG